MSVVLSVGLVSSVDAVSGCDSVWFQYKARVEHADAGGQSSGAGIVGRIASKLGRKAIPDNA